MRFDAFRVDGLHGNGTAATPTHCDSVTPTPAFRSNVRLLPCAVPAHDVGNVQLWTVDPATHRVQIVPSSGTVLCLVEANGTQPPYGIHGIPSAQEPPASGSVRVQACAAVGTDNSASLFFDAGTGRVASADGQRCLTAQQRTGVDPCARVYTSLFDPRVCTHQPANSTAILGRSAARELLCYIPGSF
eukprot:m.964402 g.964402  ORF g.964402 m.964402 type:complete len:188 (+) comp23902_c0_seq21:659-1222(+)